MQWRNSSDYYGVIARALHWGTVVLVVLAWVLGQFEDVFPRGAARRASLFVHISAGLAVLGMLGLRLGWRRIDPLPPIETGPLGARLEWVARLGHLLLYALLLVVPVSGIVLQFARGEALPLFGLAEIASPWARDRGLAASVKEVHELAANALIVLAAGHAVAALFHHWLLRDTTLVRMLPHLRRPPA